jgi:glycosyltransferase involved in cell wall biosynthesis
VKVAHLVPALFGAEGVVGGAERYVFELARHMAERVPTRLVSFAESPARRVEGALEIVTVGPPHHVRRQASNPFSWQAVHAALEADVVHCHQQHILVTSITALAARARGRRVFCTDLGGGGWDISGYVSTDRLFHGHLHISDYSRRVFGHAAFDRAQVIYGGVDAARFAPADSAVRDIECLFVGRLLPHKGVDVLLEALPDDMRAHIVGPAPDSRYVSDLRRLAEGKQVVFRHDCGDTELIGLYRRARVVVLPSVTRDLYGGQTNVPELLGQTLLEAMASGAATITTDVASLPEVVRHAVTGLVVPERDTLALRAALERMRGNPDEARRFGHAGRARAIADFSWNAVVDRCLAAYGR